eukprot:Gb_35428 [translate_table: standard]
MSHLACSSVIEQVVLSGNCDSSVQSCRLLLILIPCTRRINVVCKNVLKGHVSASYSAAGFLVEHKLKRSQVGLASRTPYNLLGIVGLKCRILAHWWVPAINRFPDELNLDRFGPRKTSELGDDSRKQGVATISDYDDYADPDPSPTNSHVHAAPIQNNAQAPSPSPLSSSHMQRNSTESQLLSPPTPN